MISIFLFIFLLIITNILITRINYIPNNSGSDHQTFANDGNVPLTGGIYIFIMFTVLFINNPKLIIFLLIIFLIGFASDKSFLVSPKKRLILQICTVLIFVHVFNLTILDTRVNQIDYLLSYDLISYTFVCFCILILINGSNFIDGLNSLLLGYFIIILYIFFKLDLLSQVGLNKNDIYFLFSILLAILLLNYFNFLFLGDSGSYLIGFFLSYFLISIYNLISNSLSPYFIIVLVWYPCFENLFSIIRKKINQVSPTKADYKHLHQLIFIFFQNKLDLKKKYLNSIVSILINLFNLCVLYTASLHYNDSIYQLAILFSSIVIYLILYFFLSMKLKSAFIKK